MDRRTIGTTTVDVTAISFGCAGLGNLYTAVSREDAHATLQAAWDGGIRYFDTAPRYGHGLAELRLGAFLYGKPKDSYVVSTKVGRVMHPVPEDQVPDYGFADPLPFAATYDYGYDGIMRSFDMSLARLGLNRVDIVYVHDIGALTHGAAENERHMRALLDGGMKALDELKRTGAIRAIGIGVNEVEVCLDVLDRGPLDCILLAGRYTLLDRSAEPELLARCAAAKTSLVVGGVFNSGILATGAIPGAPFDYAPASADIRARVSQMEAIATQGGTTLAAAALQFPLAAPAVASVLIGTSKVSSLNRNLALLETTIDPSLYSQFDRSVIGRAAPDGPAPVPR